MSDNPLPVGSLVDDADIDKIAKTLYNRFYYQYGLRYSWNDEQNGVNRKLITDQVKKVIDAMAINNFSITLNKKPVGVGRKFLSKAAKDQKNEI